MTQVTVVKQQNIRKAAVQDLRNWSQLTGRRLPYPAQLIAIWEQHGWIVDLMTGELFHSDMQDYVLVPQTEADHPQAAFRRGPSAVESEA